MMRLVNGGDMTDSVMFEGGLVEILDVWFKVDDPTIIYHRCG